MRPGVNAQLNVSPSTTFLQLRERLAKQKTAQLQHTTDYRERMDDLSRLRAAFKVHLSDFVAAMNADFGHRSWHESLASDGMPVLSEIDYIRSRLRKWMQASPRSVDLNFLPARAEVRFQPVGVVGIIAPWNYPVNLALAPLISALAAGNRVMLKPSEHTPRTAELLCSFLSGLFPEDRVACILGGADVAADFSALPFDHLFFTGSTEVGRKVMTAAAQNLTPVTLELGGKSPAIIAPGYSLTTAAERIAAGKIFNGGQTCIAPDYVLLPEVEQQTFIDALRVVVQRSYPQLETSPDYTSIINSQQFDRLNRCIEDARDKGAKIIPLLEAGNCDAGNCSHRRFPFTVVTGVNDKMQLMQEEIFGPILPLVDCTSVDAAIDYINARPKPLALYHFDHDRQRTEEVLNRTQSGGVAINDTLYHFAQHDLPFGGIGPSGMGQYHGYAGFLAFSKQKPVFYQARWSPLSWFRPPYGKLADRLVAWLTR